MFEHEEALKEYNVTYNDMPKNLKSVIKLWERERDKIYSQQEVDANAERVLKAKSAKIANEIQDFMEKDLEDEQVTPPTPGPNTNNMLSDTQKHRANELGLDPNTTTVEQLEAKEKEVADKAAAEESAKKKEAEDSAAAKAKEEAEAAAKKKAEEEAASKAKADAEDDDDLVDGLM